MNLALGLEAANAYFKEDDRRVLREQQRERFGWDRAKNESDLRLLPDMEEATRSGYRDRVAENAARAELRPLRTQITKSDLENTQRTQPEVFAQQDRERVLRAGETAAAIVRQPDVNAGLASNARVDAAVAQQKEDMIPDMIADMATKGVISGAEQSDAALGVLARRIQSNDVQGALTFANKLAAIPSIFPSTNGKKFTNITPVQNGTDAAGGTGPGYEFTYDDGTKFFTSHQTMQAAYRRSLGNPKFKFFHDWHTGEVVRADERTGDVQTARPAVPGRENTGGRGGVGAPGKKPADVQKAEWLIQNGVARDEREAWSIVTTAKQKSRSAFILDYVTRNALPGTDSDKLRQQAGQIYDRVQDDAAPKPPAPGSNSAPAGKVPGNTQFDRILGIPPTK